MLAKSADTRGERVFSAVIFDMDGLLVDSEPIWHDAESEVARKWGARWTKEDGLACTGKGIPNTARLLAEAAGFSFDPTSHTNFLVDTFLARADGVLPKPGARELVERLRALGVPLGLGSSSSLRVVARVTRAAGFEGAFSVIVTADDVALVKPAPDIFLTCAERLGAPSEQCVVLEDSATGVLAGKSAGMYVVAVPEGTDEEVAPIANAVFRNLHEASDLLVELVRPTGERRSSSRSSSS